MVAETEHPDGEPRLEGLLVAGKYRVERPIGAGGMGTVWEGRHEQLGTRVAIKFIRPTYAAHPESRARFDIEARATAMLRSRHAVQIFDCGVTEAGMPYIVMEFLEGESLSDRLIREGPLPPREVGAIVAQVAKALTKAHAAGVVHRDLKPDNVFLAMGDDGDFGLPYTVKVVDFGIAKIFQGEAPIAGVTAQPASPMGGPTQEGTVIGTPNFMSPEQLTVGGPPDPLSDLWSLGACAFTAFTARIPFEGEVLGDIVLKVCVAPMPVPSRFVPTLPAGVDAWFAKACSRERPNRFQTPQEAAAAILEVCGVHEARSGPKTEERVRYVLKADPTYAEMVEELPEPSSMSPKTAMLAGLLVGITVVAGAAAAYAWRDQIFGDPQAVPTVQDGGAAPHGPEDSSKKR